MLPSFAASVTGDRTTLLFANFYRTGALVFGGGHVVLPLLQEAVVQTGFVGKEAFLSGYGAAQAVPGPLFSFAAFLGAVANDALSGWRGGLFCLVAIYLPSFLLLFAALPFWERLRREPQAQATLKGVNAVVVGPPGRGALHAALHDRRPHARRFRPRAHLLAAARNLARAAGHRRALRGAHGRGARPACAIFS